MGDDNVLMALSLVGLRMVSAFVLVHSIAVIYKFTSFSSFVSRFILKRAKIIELMKDSSLKH